MAIRKVLVAGASGLVGHAAVRHFASLADCEVVAVSRRIPAPVGGAKFLSVDLLDQRRCREVFGQMSDVTHVVYAAVNEKPGLMEGWRDREQMQTNLAMLQNLFEPLEAVAKNLQHVSLLQGTKAYGAHLGPIALPAREHSRRHPHQNFYWLQEDYLRAKQPGKRWYWTILRPQLVIGEAVGSNLNVIPAIGVYAAIRREAGLPLSYPGGPQLIFEMVDVDLLARSMEWAAATPACRNETFNITNGDVFVWEGVWPTIAEALGMQAGAPEPSLRDASGSARANVACGRDAKARGGMGYDCTQVRSAGARGSARVCRRVVLACGLRLQFGREASVRYSGQHDQGAAGRLPRLHRYGRHAAQMVSPIPGIASAATADAMTKGTLRN